MNTELEINNISEVIREIELSKGTRHFKAMLGPEYCAISIKENDIELSDTDPEFDTITNFIIQHFYDLIYAKTHKLEDLGVLNLS